MAYDANHPAGSARGIPARSWVYAYEIELPEPELQLRSINAILDQGHTAAKAGSRTWASRIVFEPQITRILIVSDSPVRSAQIDEKLAIELRRLNANYRITDPMLVTNNSTEHAT